VWRVVLLGVVQGLAEFLPISSSGHLLLIGHWLQVSAPGASLEALLHLGTLLAVTLSVRQELWFLGRGLLQGDKAARNLFGQLALATAPAAAAGAIGGAMLANWLFQGPVVVAGFLGTTVFLWTTPRPNRGRRRLDDVTWADALMVGLVQALALVPGLSRSGSTITAARWRGLAPESACRLSFLMALPVTAGAVAINLDHLKALGPDLLIGAVVAAAMGALAIQWAVRAVASWQTWRRFGLYTLGLAALGWFSW
jgi:undecaprenyl-diphosphatase